MRKVRKRAAAVLFPRTGSTYDARGNLTDGRLVASAWGEIDADAR